MPGRPSDDGLSGVIDRQGDAPSLVFGPFRLEPARGLLLRDDAVCPLGGRALDILIALVEQAGQTVSKQDLLRRVWPNTLVTEANIRIQISALRRVLGDGQDGRRFIVNVAGQGYRFVAPVTRLMNEPALNPPAAPRRDTPRWLIPDLAAGPTQGQIRGRDAAIETVASTLDTQRCVTLTGPGGIGKTTLALAVLHRRPALLAAARFVDVACIDDPAALPSVLAGVLEGAADLAGSDGDRLLVLDGCEHLVNALAAVVEPLLYHDTRIRVLATSREALRIGVEYIIPTLPLAVLPEDRIVALAQALASPAEQLFLDRATACLGEMNPNDADAGIVSAICRRLEGLPLAIELLAGQIDQFGLTGLLRLIDDPILLVSQVRRGGLVRHASLTACVDWSLRTLSAAERTVLQRLATLPSRFSLTDAIDAAGSEAHAAILSLVARSLVIVDAASGETGFRLPVETRAVVLAADAGRFE